jgi:hypothetical protein
MRWRHRSDWVFAVCSAALIPLSYFGSFLVFESADAYSSTGGRSPDVPRPPFDGVIAVYDWELAVPVGLDGFFSFPVIARGAASEAPLDSVTFEVRNEAGELVPGTAKILDDQRTDEPQYAELLIGWEAAELQPEGAVLDATVRMRSSVEEAPGRAILTVSDATAVLTPPDFEFGVWTHLVRDRGALLECGTGAFRSEVFEFDHISLTSTVHGQISPIAVAWKYTFATTPETGAVDNLPYSAFELGPSFDTGIFLNRSFEGQRSEYCIVITARDLRTDLEYSEKFCSEEPGPTTAIDNFDSIAGCRFEDLPPGDEYRERWCRAHSGMPPECQPIVEGTAGSSGIAGSPGMAGAPDNANDTGQPSTVGDEGEKPHHTSQACALTMPPRPTACDAAALWSFALFLVARARRRKTHRPD